MPPLPRSLTSQETWGFGFSGLLLWLGTAPAMHAALGPQALYVWLPATIIGILLNLQVKRLGTYFPEVAGDTPNYMTRLLVAFVGVVIACWTSLPQIAAITEVREQVERTLLDLQQAQTQLVQA